nr:ribonuclease H-like domain-containing protein [Tanacetum cinerariifolium]
MGQSYSTNAKEVWNEVVETYSKTNGFVIFNMHYKIHSFTQSSMPSPEHYHKFNSKWRQYNSLIDLPKCTCDTAKKLKKHSQLIRLMQFLMSLDDVYSSVRSSILITDPISDVKSAFTTLSKDESHRNSNMQTSMSSSTAICKWVRAIPLMLRKYGMSMPSPEHYHKFNSQWRQYNSLIDLPKCTCDTAKKLKKHSQLIRLMQFLMSLDDVYSSVRSSILITDHISDVKSAFATLSKDESHRNSNMQTSKSSSTAFVAKSNSDCSGTTSGSHNLTSNEYKRLMSLLSSFGTGPACDIQGNVIDSVDLTASTSERNVQDTLLSDNENIQTLGSIIVEGQPEGVDATSDDDKYNSEGKDFIEFGQMFGLNDFDKNSIVNKKTVRRSSRRHVERFKARLVAKGFNQKEVIDYEDTFSLVVKMVTVRCVLSLAVQNSWSIFQLDVNNAFLYVDLAKDVYIALPEGYFAPNDTRLYKLNKSLYGLKHAPRKWNEKLSDILSEFGFDQSKNDHSLFIKSDGQMDRI